MKYLLALFIGLTLIACKDTEPVQTEDAPKENLKDNIVISGKVENGQNVTFYLEAQAKNGIIQVAEATADGTGKFKMTASIPGFGIYSLRMGETKQKVIPLTLIPEDEVEIKASSASFNTPEVTGTEWAALMTEYMKRYQEFSTQNTMLKLNPENLSDTDIEAQYKILSDSFDQFVLSSLDADPANPFNVILVPSAVPKGDFNNYPKENLTRLKRVEQSLMDRFPKSAYVEQLGYQIYQIEQQFDQHQLYLSGTVEAPEIEMTKPNGEVMRLSDLRGQVVLVDFWASWCTPCRRENPNVVRLYNKYKNKNKGFTIFSVSLDDKSEKWTEAIAKDNLSWPNHVSDLKGWESPVIQSYGFSGIPFTALLNEEGKYIGIGLRGEKLEQKLKELFEN